MVKWDHVKTGVPLWWSQRLFVLQSALLFPPIAWLAGHAIGGKLYVDVA